MKNIFSRNRQAGTCEERCQVSMYLKGEISREEFDNAYSMINAEILENSGVTSEQLQSTCSSGGPRRFYGRIGGTLCRSYFVEEIHHTNPASNDFQQPRPQIEIEMGIDFTN